MHSTTLDWTSVSEPDSDPNTEPNTDAKPNPDPDLFFLGSLVSSLCPFLNPMILLSTNTHTSIYHLDSLNMTLA